MEIKARNVNDALNSALWYLKTAGVREPSRNGAVIVAPEPVMTTYDRPTERVLWWGERDCNPYFHFMESLWMLAGRDDVAFVNYFNGRMGNFSDNGETLNGAYGHRWRRRFGRDQLVNIVHHLNKNPESRRAVLTMWGPEEDLAVVEYSKDVCCNTAAYFDLRGGVLNMTVLNRSNDAVWGAYGANAVHFSFLQDFIAGALGAPVGVYRQFSNNLHIYTDLYGTDKYTDPPTEIPPDYYLMGSVKPVSLGVTPGNWGCWLQECERFCNAPALGYTYMKFHPVSFFEEVALPMYQSYAVRKDRRGTGREELGPMLNCDWKQACYEWLDRRENAKKSA